MDNRRTVALIGASGVSTRSVVKSLASYCTSAVTSEVDHWRLTTLESAAYVLRVLEIPTQPRTDSQLRDAIFAVDALCFVTSAEFGLNPEVARIWSIAQEFRTPCIILVTDLQHGRVDIDEMTHIARRVFDEPDAIHVIVQPAFNDDETLGGVIDVIHLNIQEGSGGTSILRPCEPEHVSLLSDSRSDLIFHVASRTDDATFVEQVRSGMQPRTEAFWQAARMSIRSGDLFPVLPLDCQAPHVGITELVNLIIGVVPPPTTKLPVIIPVPPRTATPDQPTVDASLCAQVLAHDGDQSLIRMWTGSWGDDAQAGDMVVGRSEEPLGTVLSEPPNSLRVESPAV